MKKTSIKNFVFLCFALLCTIPSHTQAREVFGRLGIGMSNQAASDIQSISLKIQTSKYFSLGGIFGFDTSDAGGQVAGVKIYQNFINEPQLVFYGCGLVAYLNQKNSGSGQSGFQADITLGSEFSIPQVDSIGLSFEFGISLINVDDLTIKTTGLNFINAAIHFYL